MKERLKNIDTKFTLQGSINGLLIVIVCVLLGFILDTFKTQVKETISFRSDLNTYVKIQNDMMVEIKQLKLQDDILFTQDEVLFTQFDTIEISVYDAKQLVAGNASSIRENTGRIIKLEKDHEN